MKKRVRKNRRRSKKFLSLQPVVHRPTFCGFPIVEKNHNQLWKWDTLENVKL